MLSNKLAASAALIFAASLPVQATASTFDFSFAGPGVFGSITLTYGVGTDAKYPQAFEVTGITGTFTDSNNGLNIVNEAILGLEPINHATPELTNTLAPNDFSKYGVAAGLPDQNHGSLSYDNLYYPGGSPQAADDYPFHGGVFDIYGMMFHISGDRVVNLWSNGDFSPTGKGPIDYGVAVASREKAVDYVGGGVAAVPEPSTYVLLGGGLLLAGLRIARRQRSK